MSRLDDWDDPLSTFVLLAIIFGFGSLIVLADTAPLVTGMVLFGLGFLGIMGWSAANRSDASDDEEQTAHERDSIAVLKERYARGEISEGEFKHQVAVLLDVDEIAARKQETELAAERE